MLGILGDFCGTTEAKIDEYGDKNGGSVVSMMETQVRQEKLWMVAIEMGTRWFGYRRIMGAFVMCFVSV